MELQELLNTIRPVVGSIDEVLTPPQGGVYAVFVLRTQRGHFVLKQASPQHQQELQDEAAVLSALSQYVPIVPQPIEVQPQYVIFTYVPGQDLFTRFRQASIADQRQLILSFGQMLRTLHSWQPPLPQPKAWLHETLIEMKQRFAQFPATYTISGTHTRFDGERADHLLEQIPRDLPEDIAFGHGDYCLPNVLVNHDVVTGVIDWSCGGYRDRRFDLATGVFNLRLHSDDPRLITTFLTAYGYQAPLDSLYSFEILHALSCAGWE